MKKKTSPPKNVKQEDSGSDTEPEYDVDPYVEEVRYIISESITHALTRFICVS